APAAVTAAPEEKVQPSVGQPVVAQTPAMQQGQPVIAEPEVTATKPSRQPGQTVKSAVDPGPTRLTPPAMPAATDPTVSVSRTSAADAPHGSHGKWYVLAAVAVAAGAGAAFAMKGKSGSAATPNSASLTIGNPSISVGHP
ncbi:MAG: hypothetical protein JO051_11490, partial [Acidobacteriaceae bacterium]|nr:hypothetical protein [Acidobacteriaceae bacterium]